MMVEYFIAIVYFSLAVELIFFPVKSSGSTYQLILEQKLNGKDRILAVLINIMVVLTILYPISNLFFKWDNLSRSITMISLGVVLAIFGRLFSFGAMVQLRNNENKLQTDKFFKISRNPNIDGTLFLLIGMWFFMPSILFLTAMPYVFYYMISRAKFEEIYLEEKFGQSFSQFKSTSKRSIFYDRD
jgi:protein-S-isoprenylcysteine O-methyltransferase Ste14